MALGVTVAEIDKILKLDYQGPIREMLINKNVLLSILKKDYSRDSFQGEKSVIPVHTGRNIGRGWRAEDAIIPFPGKQSHDTVSFHVAYLYGRIGITGQTIAQSRNDKGAFARALDLELKGLVTDMAITMQKAVWSDASGRLTNLQSRGTGTGIAGSAVVNNNNQDLIQVKSDRWLEVGQPVFVSTRSGVNSTGSKKGLATASDGTVRIAQVFAGDLAGVAPTVGYGGSDPREGFTVKLENYDPATGLATGSPTTVLGSGGSFDLDGTSEEYALYLYGSRGAPSVERPAGDTAFGTDWTTPQELWGLHALVSDQNPSGWTDSDASLRTVRGLLGETDRTDATKTWWKSNVVDCGHAVDVTLDKWQEAYDVSEIEGASTSGAILTSYRIRRAFAALFAGSDFRRFGTEKELATGWTGISFNNSVVLCDKDAHDPGDPRDAEGVANCTWFDDAYFLSREAIKWIVMEDMSWEDTGGTIVREGVGAQARDRYEAWMKAYWNIINERPRAHTKLSNIKFTAS